VRCASTLPPPPAAPRQRTVAPGSAAPGAGAAQRSRNSATSGRARPRDLQAKLVRHPVVDGRRPPAPGRAGAAGPREGQLHLLAEQLDDRLQLAGHADEDGGRATQTALRWVGELVDGGRGWWEWMGVGGLLCGTAATARLQSGGSPLLQTSPRPSAAQHRPRPAPVVVAHRAHAELPLEVGVHYVLDAHPAGGVQRHEGVCFAFCAQRTSTATAGQTPGTRSTAGQAVRRWTAAAAAAAAVFGALLPHARDRRQARQGSNERRADASRNPPPKHPPRSKLLTTD